MEQEQSGWMFHGRIVKFCLAGGMLRFLGQFIGHIKRIIQWTRTVLHPYLSYSVFLVIPFI